jgi:hypothetical protein
MDFELATKGANIVAYASRTALVSRRAAASARAWLARAAHTSWSDEAAGTRLRLSEVHLPGD